jgi:hypothetical protein
MDGPDEVGEFYDWYFDDFYLAEGEYAYINNFSTNGQMLTLNTGDASISSGTNISFTISDILNPIDSEIYSDFLLWVTNKGTIIDGPWDTNDVTINPVVNEGNIEINAGSTLLGARTYYNFSVTTTENIPAGKTVKIIFPEGYGLTPAGISVDYQNIIIPEENILTPEKFYNIENTSPAEVTDASNAFSGAYMYSIGMPAGSLDLWQSLTTSTWQYIQFSEDPLANPSDYLVTSTYGNSSSSYSLWSHRGCISEEFPGSGNCTESHDYIYVSKIDNLKPSTTYSMYF